MDRHSDIYDSTSSSSSSSSSSRSRSRSRSKSRSRSTSFPPEPSDKPQKIEPSFEPSGLLAAETNERNGIIIKYTIPPESRMPDKKWRLYMFKSQVDTTSDAGPDKIIHLSNQEYYLIGKEPRVCDLPVYHSSISKQHAVIQFRLRGSEVLPYLIDLGSTNGTFLNGEKIEPSRYYQLLEKDSIKFAYSSREYILLHLDS